MVVVVVVVVVVVGRCREVQGVGSGGPNKDFESSLYTLEGILFRIAGGMAISPCKWSIPLPLFPF